MRGRDASVHGVVIEFDYPGIGRVVDVLGAIGDDIGFCPAKPRKPCGDVGHGVVSVYLHLNLLEPV